MIRKEFIISVPHTGTRFLKKHLDLQHMHTSVPWGRIIQKVEKYDRLHCPLRDPQDVWRSWCRRRPGQDPMRILNNFWSAWSQLNRLDQRYQIRYHQVELLDGERIGEGEHQDNQWTLHKVDLRPFYHFPFMEGRYDDKSGRVVR